MQRMLIPTVASMVIVLGLGGTSSADMLTVIGFSHPPNYKLCTDQNDIHQLTDRKVTTFPIWMQKETVGWAAATPIAIELRLILTGTVQRPQSGRLRLHSAKGLGAGVDIPRHVDVYARDDNDKLILVGSLTPNSGKLPDKSAYWLDIDIQAATDSLVVVLHAAGSILRRNRMASFGNGSSLSKPFKYRQCPCSIGR
jgi:hypothetical protein